MVMVITGSTASFGATVPVTFGGVDYEVSTDNGTDAEHGALLRSHVWWPDHSLAQTFSDFLQDSLGLSQQNTFGLIATAGPKFVYGDTSEPYPFLSSHYWTSIGSIDFAAFRDSSTVFAIASVIETPSVSTVPLLAGGLLLFLQPRDCRCPEAGKETRQRRGIVLSDLNGPKS